MNAVHALKAARAAGVRLGLDGVSLMLVRCRNGPAASER